MYPLFIITSAYFLTFCFSTIISAMNNKKQKTMNWQQIQSDHSYQSRSEDWPLNNPDWPLPNSISKTLPLKPSIPNPVNKPKKKPFSISNFFLHKKHNTAELLRTDANSSSINSIHTDREDDKLHIYDCPHPSYLLQQSILKSVSKLKTKRPGSIIISSAVSFPTVPRVLSDYIFMDICNKNTMGNAL